MKRIAIAELEGVALDAVIMDVFGMIASEMLVGKSSTSKRSILLKWGRPDGFVEVPDELVEGSDEPVSV